ELQRRVLVVVGDRKDALEHRLEAHVLAVLRRVVLLQERLVRVPLDLDQIRDLDDRRNLPEVATDATAALNLSCHLSPQPRCSGAATSHPRPPPPAPAPPPPPPPGNPPGPQNPAIPVAGSVQRAAVDTQRYLISTAAPTSSSFFFMSSASAFDTFSLTALG